MDEKMNQDMPEYLYVSINPLHPAKGALYNTASVPPRLGGNATQYRRADIPTSDDIDARTMQRIEICPGVEVHMTQEQIIAWRTYKDILKEVWHALSFYGNEDGYSLKENEQAQWKSEVHYIDVLRDRGQRARGVIAHNDSVIGDKE